MRQVIKIESIKKSYIHSRQLTKSVLWNKSFPKNHKLIVELLENPHFHSNDFLWFLNGSCSKKKTMICDTFMQIVFK